MTNRSRVFDSRANVEVFALWIVSGNEVEAAVVLVIDTGSFVKPPGLVGLNAWVIA